MNRTVPEKFGDNNAMIIGCGHMGLRYVKMCRELNIQVSAVVDNNVSLPMDDVDISMLPSDSVDKYLDKNKIDLLIIATTCPSHFDYIMKGASRQIKYILCEKPITSSVKQIQTILTEMEQISPLTHTAVNHQMRFMTHYINIKSIITSNEMGKLSSISVQAGNFGFAMNATHYIELFRYLTDENPTQVQGWLSPQTHDNPRGAEFKDFSGSMKIATQSGISMHINASETQGHGIFVIFTFETGQLFLDELSGQAFKSKRRNHSDINKSSLYYALESETMHFELDPLTVYEPTKKVLISLLEKDNYPTLHDASFTIKTIVGAICSSEENSRTVNVDDIPEKYKSIIYNWA